MNDSIDDASSRQAIDLAQQPEFDLGVLRVRPASCEVRSNGAGQILQRRVMQVLVALSQSEGSVVSQDELVARCWRGLSVTDDAIFRCISKLRKFAKSYSDPPFAIETIPGVGYRLTSSGFRVTEPSTLRPSPPAQRSHRRALALTAGILMLLFIAAAAFWLDRKSRAEGRSMQVVVRPFEALGSSADARALALRVPNEIVDALGDSRIEAVLSREQGEKTASSAQSALGVIVTGILRNDGHNTTANVRIEDGTSRAALWSNEFRRDSGAAADLPLEVAARVADVVSMINFARTANPPLKDDSALTAVLQTNDLIRDAGQDDWAQMLDRAQAIVARSPKFAFGHSLLAVAYSEAAENAGVADRAQAMREVARKEANLTLKLDPQDAGAYAVLAGLSGLTLGERQAILLRGIKVAKHPKQPVAALYSSEAKVLTNAGRFNEALSFQLIAYATDQWGAPKTAQLARTYANVGHLAVATNLVQKGLRLWPNHSGIRRAERYVIDFYGDPADAAAILDRQDPTSASNGDADVWRTFVEARLAHSPDRIAAAARRIREAGDQNVIPREYEIMMLASLGKPGEAIEVANAALDQLRLESWILFAPVTRNVRQDPGFVELLYRLGLIQYWRQTATRPDICTDPKKGAECGPQLLAALKPN